MIIYALIVLVINIISVILSPFSIATGFVFNVFEDVGFLSALRVLTFFISSSTILFFISTFLFWSSVFILRPLINFIRNRG